MSFALYILIGLSSRTHTICNFDLGPVMAKIYQFLCLCFFSPKDEKNYIVCLVGVMFATESNKRTYLLRAQIVRQQSKYNRPICSYNRFALRQNLKSMIFSRNIQSSPKYSSSPFLHILVSAHKDSLSYSWVSCPLVYISFSSSNKCLSYSNLIWKKNHLGRLIVQHCFGSI